MFLFICMICLKKNNSQVYSLRQTQMTVSHPYTQVLQSFICSQIYLFRFGITDSIKKQHTF